MKSIENQQKYFNLKDIVNLSGISRGMEALNCITKWPKIYICIINKNSLLRPAEEMKPMLAFNLLLKKNRPLQFPGPKRGDRGGLPI